MPNSYDLLMLKKTPQEVIQSISDKLDIILASNQLSRVAIELDKTGKEYRLKEVLAPVKDKYELIIIDTPPALGILTINALTIAKRIKNGNSFSEPEKVKLLREEYMQTNNSAISFWNECITDINDNNNQGYTTSKIFDVYKDWCRDNNNGRYKTRELLPPIEA